MSSSKDFEDREEMINFLKLFGEFPKSISRDEDYRVKIARGLVEPIEISDQNIYIQRCSQMKSTKAYYKTSEENNFCLNANLDLTADSTSCCLSKLLLEKIENESKLDQTKTNESCIVRSEARKLMIAIDPKDVKLKAGVEEEIEKIIFGERKEKNSYYERLKDLQKYLDRIGYFVPTKIYYGAMLYYTCYKRKKSKDSFYGYRNNCDTYDIQTETKTKLEEEFENVTINSIGTVNPVTDYNEFKNEMNKSSYDAITYDDIIPFTELLSERMKELVTNFLKNSKLNVDLEESENKKWKANKKGKYYGETKFFGMIKKGKGVFFYDDGNVYKGEFDNSKKDGKGILYFKDGDRYEGDFKGDKIEGNGIMYFSNGDKYDGEWKNEKMDGKGVYLYVKGGKYVGNFKEGKKEDEEGKNYDNDGGYEVGKFKGDKKTGVFKSYDKEGNFVKEVNYNL